MNDAWFAPYIAPFANATCHCHIGYVHLDELELNKVVAGGILERIPAIAQS
jgi:hypothetical protein